MFIELFFIFIVFNSYILTLYNGDNFNIFLPYIYFIIINYIIYKLI